MILAGGTAVRMDGVDKASVEYAGRTLLEQAHVDLAAVAAQSGEARDIDTWAD
ncbi:MAG: NTP transferase domain-containing protein, partial [Nocardioides sp.]